MRQPTLPRIRFVAFLPTFLLSTFPVGAESTSDAAPLQHDAATARLIGAYPAGVRPDRFWINSDTGEYWAIVERDDRIVVIHDGVAAEQTFDRLARATAISFDDQGKPYFFATDGDRDFEVRGDSARPLAQRIDTALSVRPMHVGAAMTPVFAAAHDGGQVLYMGDVVSPVSTKPVSYSANSAGDRFAYIIAKGGKENVLLNGASHGGLHSEIGRFRLSADGDRLAYFANDDGAWKFRNGDLLSRSFGALFGAEISGDAKRFIAAVERDGALAIETDSGSIEVSTELSNVMAINEDGSRTAHLRPGDTAGTHIVVVDRIGGPPLRAISNIEFSASGTKAAYWGLGENRRGLIWINGATLALDRNSRSIENAGFVGETLFWLAKSGSRTIIGRNNAIIARHRGQFRYEAADERHGVVASRQRSNAAPVMALNDVQIPVPSVCRSILHRSVRVGEKYINAACVSKSKEIWTFRTPIPKD